MPDTDTLVRNEFLKRIEAKKRRLESKRPLSKRAVERLLEGFKLYHTYNSNAIEGNTLTLQETKVVIEEGITIGGKSVREHLEATNNAEAFDYIVKVSKKKEKIDNITVLKIHEIVTKGILPDAGRFRTRNVRITGAKKSPPDFSKVPRLVDELLKSLNNKRDAITNAAYLHHGLAEIHPFSDGNGRVARLLTNLYLLRKGYPPIVLKKEDRLKYYEYLRAADSGDLAPFVDFIAKAVDESLMQYLSVFGGKDELLPLKELAKQYPYSQEYLSLRARQGRLDAVKIGNVWHTTRRAVEEYITAVKS